MALVAAGFVLLALLDNVPDSPSLLNRTTRASVSLQLANHPDIGAIPQQPYATQAAVRADLRNIYCVSDVLIVVAPSCVARLLYQAADPSPPIA